LGLHWQGEPTYLVVSEASQGWRPLTHPPACPPIFKPCLWPQGDPTYLVVSEVGLESYGVNSICTHLGCVVPWNSAENKVSLGA